MNPWRALKNWIVPAAALSRGGWFPLCHDRYDFVWQKALKDWAAEHVRP